MPRSSATARLAAVARPLRPARAPFYVRHPLPPGLQRQFPADGWYWMPRGHNVAVFLGRSEREAYHELVLMVEREEAAA